MKAESLRKGHVIDSARAGQPPFAIERVMTQGTCYVVAQSACREERRMFQYGDDVEVYGLVRATDRDRAALRTIATLLRAIRTRHGLSHESFVTVHQLMREGGKSVGMKQDRIDRLVTLRLLVCEMTDGSGLAIRE